MKTKLIALITRIWLVILAFLNLIKNKIISMGALVALVWFYRNLPERSPFVELVYVLILINLIMVVAPLMRLLVFNEAARYAESGQLDKDLATGRMPSAYLHYRFATTICYACTTVCVGALAFI